MTASPLPPQLFYSYMLVSILNSDFEERKRKWGVTLRRREASGRAQEEGVLLFLHVLIDWFQIETMN